MLGKEVHCDDEGVAQNGNIIAVGAFVVVEVRVVLKGVHLDVAAVERVVGKREIRELNQLQRDALRSQRLDGRPPKLLVNRARDAEFHDAALLGLVGAAR